MSSQSLVSGGVDSTVCTALLVSALGPEKVIAVHVDNGFMRQDESAKVKESLEALGLRLNGEAVVSEEISSKYFLCKISCYKIDRN